MINVWSRDELDSSRVLTLSVPESAGAPSPKWQEELVRRRKLSDRRPDPSAASGHFRDHLHPWRLADGRPDELVSASADSASGLLRPVELVCRASRGLPARGARPRARSRVELVPSSPCSPARGAQFFLLKVQVLSVSTIFCEIADGFAHA
jgi:hypothetical protein